MTVNKITSAPTQNETIEKINEIIDNLGGGGTTGVFVATYGTTTRSEIYTARDAGLVCICIYNDKTYYLSRGAIFCETEVENGYVRMVYIDANEVWRTDNYPVVISVNNTRPTAGNVNISIPTATSDLTNDSGFITGISSSDVTTALGYTPYDSSNPNGYTSNVGTVTSVNNTSPDNNGNVTLSIPDTSTLANTSLSNLNSTGNNLVNTALNTNDNTTRLKFWTGTKAQYDAISTKDSNTLYNITDDQDITLTLLQTIYPVGSVYLSTNATCPLASLFGTWTLVSSGKALWTGTGSNGNTTISAGLPNLAGGTGANSYKDYVPIGYPFYRTSTTHNVGASGTQTPHDVYFDASLANSIYGNSTTVQPPAYVVNVWRRTA